MVALKFRRLCVHDDAFLNDREGAFAICAVEI